MTYVVRHVSTPLNAQNRMRAGSDPPLSFEGRKQLAQVGRFFQGMPLTAIHTDNTTRSTETGHLIGRVTRAPVKIDQRLKPWTIPGLTGQHMTTAAPMLARLFQAPMAHHPSGGDSFAEFFNRFMPAMKAILKRPAHERHVVITHGRNIKLLQSLLRGGGKFDPSTPPHDPTGTEPGDIYQVTPSDLKLLLRVAPTTGTSSRMAS